MENRSKWRVVLARLRFVVAHLVPRTHWGVYTSDSGQRRFMIWRQWGARVRNFEQFEVPGWEMGHGLPGGSTHEDGRFADG